LQIQQTIKRQIEKWRGFLNGVQVGVEILTSKIRMKTAINLKMA
jgi:hypothetical protein